MTTSGKAESIDTPEFRELLKKYHHSTTWDTKLIAHIEAWGAKGREIAYAAGLCNGARDERNESKAEAEEAAAPVTDLAEAILALPFPAHGYGQMSSDDIFRSALAAAAALAKQVPAQEQGWQSIETAPKAESIDVEKLRELAQAAKPGPWKYNPVTTEVECDFDDENSCSAIVYVNSGDFTHRLTIAHGEFIAAANPAVILALIDRIAHIEAVREKDREAARRLPRGQLKAQIMHMTHRLETALAANRQLEAELKAIAERQAPDLSKLKRYDFQGNSEYEACRVPSPTGEYVEFDDVQALLSPAQQEPAKSIPGEGCNYLWFAGSVCNKCGKVHKEAARATDAGRKGTLFGLDKETIIQRAMEHGMDLDMNPVAYEFRNFKTGHAIVDYSRHTHVGYLAEKDGYVARPLTYADATPAQATPEGGQEPAIIVNKVVTGYEGGLMVSDPDGGGTITLHYKSAEEAENAFNELTKAFDKVIKNDK